MNKYIQNVFNNAIPNNKGYIYVKTEAIYIPIFKVALSITKRRQTNLNLVEEIVLRIVDCDINDLDEIAGIMGLKRDILDITIADLHVKSLIYQTSNKCFLYDKGRQALKELKTFKREKDIVSDIYVNSLNKEIYSEKGVLIDQCKINDMKVHHVFDGKDIGFYRNQMTVIREIFNEQNVVNSNNKPDELITIDEIEEITVCYLRMPINIYVSETGNDIDILATDSKQNELFESIKNIIITQIRKQSLLKNIFSRYQTETYSLPQGDFEEPIFMQSLIKLYATDQGQQQNHLRKIEQKIFTNRILIENEFEHLCNFIFREKQTIKLFIDNLDAWSKNGRFITFLSDIPKSCKYKIYYNKVGNFRLSTRRIKNAIPHISANDIEYNAHNYWFRLIIDNKIQIIGVPENHAVMDDNKYIIKPKYYLLK